ncbi:MAG: glycosyltransferase [Victivallales bacterium]|nr:glycosyltransferase [Victivallales bacterium]
MTAKFSLITITLNAQGKLPRCISSILGQTRLPDEYLFIDGGSQDGTIKIIEEALPQLKAKGVNARLLRQNHKEGHAGIPEAWNQGITQATGDIIGLLNSDDFYLPETIKTVVKAFSENANLELLSSPISMVSPDGAYLYSLYPHCLCMSEIKMPVPHPGTFASAPLYKRIGLYDENYRISADYDFIWRCRKAKANTLYLEKTLVNMEAGGMANSSRELARKETLAIALKHSRIPLLARIAYLLRKITGK